MDPSKTGPHEPALAGSRSAAVAVYFSLSLKHKCPDPVKKVGQPDAPRLVEEPAGAAGHQPVKQRSGLQLLAISRLQALQQMACAC